MSIQSEFFLNSETKIVELECIEISHSLFSQTYRVVRNATRGVTVTHEDSSVHDYTYNPMRCELTGVEENLDHGLRVEFGDLGQVIPAEIDNIRGSDGFNELPVVKYRTYRSDNLTTLLDGPLVLEIKQFQFDRSGSFFEAKAPSLNSHRTGETFSVARFPMLRGFLQ